jgi:hypothetical protein
LDTKTFIKNIDGMTKRAFEKLRAEYPDFNLYTALIYIDFIDAIPAYLNGKKEEDIISRAVCTIGFDDLANSLKCADAWIASADPRNEHIDRNSTRTYRTQDLLIKEVERIECEGVNIKDAHKAIMAYKRCSKVCMTANAQAQGLNIAKGAALVFLSETWLSYYGMYGIADFGVKRAKKGWLSFGNVCFLLFILFFIYLFF